MIDIAQQSLEFYLKYKKTPELRDLTISDTSLLDREAEIFVTLYHKWEIAGSSGNFKAIESSAAQEVIVNTIAAASKDPRFTPLSLDQLWNIKIQIDEITSREIIRSEKELAEVDPVKFGVIALTAGYKKACVILPNISPLLLMWSDIAGAISSKLWEAFDEKSMTIYKIETNSVNNI